MTNIGIVGIGVVGSAAYKSFVNKNINVLGYDKFKNIGKFEDILNTNIVFLCLPTLYDYQKKSYDKSAIHEVCELLKENNYEGIVVIKSTVEPTISQTIADKYNLHIFHNPEFLTARTAYEDFHYQKHIVIGKTSHVTDDHSEYLVNFYKKYYPDAEISICNSTESESMKIFCNTFYAVKIQFFNELYLLCDKINIEYDTVKNMMLKNGWINPMHTAVPGTDGKLSYGGMCFPKDTNALLSFMKYMNTPYKILESVIHEHNDMRDN